jgi:hypothetical protein
MELWLLVALADCSCSPAGQVQPIAVGCPAKTSQGKHLSAYLSLD